MNTIFCFSFVSILAVCACLPPHRRADTHIEEDNKIEHEGYPDMEELGIEYTRYLRQVIDTLEKDETFKKKLENAEEHDIKSARIAEELEYVNHHVRTKLDELKRTELHRLKDLAKKMYGHDTERDSAFGHIDRGNPNTFEIQDLKKLIRKTAQDLEEADRKRKEEFKTYEMEKHFEREQKLKNMTEEQRKTFIQHEEEAKRQEEIAAKRVHHPGSKQQLEEVWEHQDHMSKDEFNPRTFFVMHDIDNNGFLDEEEIKALFVKELDKLYASGTLQGDAVERAEEMERMREHVFNEVDKNKDRLISWEEFYAMSAQPEFTEDPGWQPMDNNQVYSSEEWQAYERQRMNEIETLRRAGKLSDQVYYPSQHNGGYPDPNVPYGANGYAQQPYYPQQGVHQPQGAYQQQGVHQPQGAYQQQGVHQPQGAYQQQGVHQSQGAYPQQGVHQPQGAYPQQGVHPQQAVNNAPQMGGYPQQYPQPPAGHAQQQAVPQEAHFQNQGAPPQQQALHQNQVPVSNAIPQQHAIPVQEPVAPANVPQNPVPAQQFQQPQQTAAPQPINNANVQQAAGGQFHPQNIPDVKAVHDQKHFESKTN